MLAQPRTGLLFLGCVFLVFITTSYWPLTSSIFSRRYTTMENLSKPFTIQINDKYVAPVDASANDGIQAKVGSEAATFTLKDGRLVSGDWILGRNLTEDRTFGPKKIGWFKDEAHNAQRLHTVTAHQEGESHRLKFGGMFFG